MPNAYYFRLRIGECGRVKCIMRKMSGNVCRWFNYRKRTPAGATSSGSQLAFGIVWIVLLFLMVVFFKYILNREK
eukprot:1194412-Prorocentrum_minimum.AAC.10